MRDFDADIAIVFFHASLGEASIKKMLKVFLNLFIKTKCRIVKLVYKMNNNFISVLFQQTQTFSYLN